MDRPCNDSIRKTIKLAEQMLQLADEGDHHREDVGCGILYGILRDSAYRIRDLAERERKAHIEKGWWPSDVAVDDRASRATGEQQRIRGPCADPCDDV